MKNIFPILSFLTISALVKADEGYQVYKDINMIYKLHKIKSVWYDATRVCRSENSRLAMPSNAAEAAILKEILNNYTLISDISLDKQITKANLLHHHVLLLGFHDKFVEGEYLTESDLSIQNFYHQWEKNRHAEKRYLKRCGAMNREGLLSDISCNEAAIFVCQQPYATAATQYHIFGRDLSTCGDCLTGPPYKWKNAYIDSLWARGKIDESLSSISICKNNVTLTMKYKKDKHNGVSDLDLRNGYRHIHNLKNLYKLHLNVKTWFEARAICEAENAHLVVLDDDKETFAMYSFINQPFSIANIDSKNNTLIGHHNLFVPGVSHTIFGDLDRTTKKELPKMFSNMTPPPPLHECQAMRSSWLGGFPCTVKSIFVCEKETPPMFSQYSWLTTPLFHG